MIKSLNRRQLTVWVISLLLFGFVWSLIPWADLKAIATVLSVRSLAVLFLLDIVIVLTMSGRWWFILQGLGHPVNYLHLSAYRLAAFGVSYFTPGPQFGGEPLQVWALKSKQQVPTSSALASVTVDKLLEMFVNFSVLAGAAIVVVQTAVLPNNSAGLLLAVALFLWMAPVAFIMALAKGWTPLTTLFRSVVRRPIFAKLSQRFATQVGRFDHAILTSEAEATRLWQNAPRSLVFALLISLLTWVLWLLEFWLMYVLLGLSLGLNELLIAVTAVRVAFLLPLPAGLGTLEASQYVAMVAIGQATAIGLSATVFIRVRDFVLGGVGLWMSGRLFRENK